MSMSNVLIAFFLVFEIVSALPHSCTLDSECAKDECCQILRESLIVSRRDLPVLATIAPRTGICQKYKFEGDHCGAFDQAYGHCSCAPGLNCHGEEARIPAPLPIGKRDMRPSRPGYYWEYKCTKV